VEKRIDMLSFSTGSGSFAQKRFFTTGIIPMLSGGGLLKREGIFHDQ